MRKWNTESKVAEVLYDGEATASFIALQTALSIRAVQEALGNLIRNGEVDARIAPDRSGQHGRSQTFYFLTRTKGLAA